MGWGLLDKTSLIVTEDENTPLLQSILDQWPEIRSKTAIWPVFGAENLPTAEGAKALKSMLGLNKLVVHRDADFMIGAERSKLRGRFDGSGCELWITAPSDIEGYFCDRDHLKQCFHLDEETAEDFLSEAWKNANDPKTFKRKRSQINKNDKFYPGGGGTPNLADAEAELNYHYAGTIKGKKLLGALKSIIHKEINVSPQKVLELSEGGNVAEDLKALLED